MRLVASISSVAAAAAIAAVALIVPVNSYEPQDTFDDPALACAEAVRGCQSIGDGRSQFWKGTLAGLCADEHGRGDDVQDYGLHTECYE